jgi:hypothetical protein
MSAVSVSVHDDLTLMRAEGSLSAEDILATLERFYEGDPTLYVVWDVTAAGVVDVSLRDAEAIAALVMRHRDRRTGGKTAIVAPKDQQYGIGRMLGSMAEVRALEFDVATFRSRADAEEWLGRPIPR